MLYFYTERISLQLERLEQVRLFALQRHVEKSKHEIAHIYFCRIMTLPRLASKTHAIRFLKNNTEETILCAS